MFLKIHVCISLFLYFGATKAYDPIQGFLVPNCIEGRPITGCNETLLEAYKRTPASKSDQNINPADTRAYLYTPESKEYPEFMHDCGGRLPVNTLYKAEQDTVIIIGAHLSSICNLAFFRDMKNQLFIRGRYNVIIIDWYWGNGVDVYGVASNSAVVGRQMGFIILNIMALTGASPDRFHIVGHGQGAQAAGIAGRYIYIMGGEKIRRITGLDPTRPTTPVSDTDGRLDPSDAKLVDVIHGDTGECFPLSLGLAVNSGHADFYPNGGSVQLSCYPGIVNALLKGDLFLVLSSLYPAVCFIYQSVQYFIVSINACQCEFIGVECDTYDDFKSKKCRSCGEDGSKCAVMGMDWEQYPLATGSNHSYYLDTTLSCPYCDNRGIKLQGFPNHTTQGDNELHCFNPRG